MIKRRVSKAIQVGDVTVGGNAPITVQSMTKTDTRDVQATVRQIKELEEVGCDIIRPAVPDMQAAIALKEIKKQVKISKRIQQPHTVGDVQKRRKTGSTFGLSVAYLFMCFDLQLFMGQDVV
mgnify:CR=1 FL=1